MLEVNMRRARLKSWEEGRKPAGWISQYMTATAMNTMPRRLASRGRGLFIRLAVAEYCIGAKSLSGIADFAAERVRLGKANVVRFGGVRPQTMHGC